MQQQHETLLRFDAHAQLRVVAWCLCMKTQLSSVSELMRTRVNKCTLLPHARCPLPAPLTHPGL